MIDVNSTSPYLSSIEQSIAEIQQGKKIDYNLEMIRKMINVEFKANCVSVNLIENDTKGFFFGMYMIPTEKKLLEITDKVIKDGDKVKFESCKDFIIEIDSKLVYDMGATPREITAALIHEIGHKVFSTEEQVRLYGIFTAEILKFGAIGMAIYSKFAPFKTLMLTIGLFAFTGFLKELSNVKGEIDADSLAVKYGYGRDLYSLLNKFTGDDLKALKLMNSEKDNDMRVLTRWTIKNILNFSLRKSKIKNELSKQITNEKSIYAKSIIKTQIKFVENTRAMFSPPDDKAITESVRSFIEIKKKGYSNLEIDELEIEIERIEDPEDKIYLTKRIHRNIQTAYLAMKELEDREMKLNPAFVSGKFKLRETDEIKSYISAMNSLLEKIRNVKIKKRERLAINIEYPAGYRG